MYGLPSGGSLLATLAPRKPKLSAALYNQKARISQRKRRKVVRKACSRGFMSISLLGVVCRHPQPGQRVVAEVAGFPGCQGPDRALPVACLPRQEHGIADHVLVPPLL